MNKGGSIIDFVMQQEKCNLGEARKKLRDWLGKPQTPRFQEFKIYLKPQRCDADRRKASIEFATARVLDCSNKYLQSRYLDSQYYLMDRSKGRILTDRYNNVLFPHQDHDGFYGFEKRNFKFNGYTEYGQRCLWFSNFYKTDKRYFFGESGIDCLSHFQMFNDGRTAYFSTGGQISDIQLDLMKAVREKNPEVEFLLGFDNDPGGKKFVKKIRSKIGECRMTDTFPEKEGQDWNDVLKSIMKKSSK